MMVMICHHKDCFLKIFPKQPIPIRNNILYNYGNIINNNYISNTNIYNCCDNCRNNCKNNKKENESANMDKDNYIEINDNFKIFEDSELNELIFKSLNGTNISHAKLLFYVGKSNFAYSENIWYEFKDHKWNSNRIYNFRAFILGLINDYYTQIINYYKKNKNDIQKINFINSQKQYLLSLSIDSNIFVEASNFYLEYDNNFKDKLNKNPNLIGFNNGIYDLEQLEFRNGKYTDYNTMSVNYDYIPGNIPEQLIMYLQQLLPDDKLKHYVFKLLGYCLYKEFNLQQLFVFTGYDSNGKKLFIKLIKETFGEYCEFINFTQNIQYNNLVINGKKLILLNYENIISFDNILTTLFDIYYKNNINSFHLILISNRVPDIIINNIKIVEIPINISFTHDDEIKIKNIIETYKHLFMNELIKYYSIYKKEKIDNINEINVSKSFNILFKEYTNSYIIKTNNENDIITWTFLKKHFKSWISNKITKKVSSRVYKKDFESFFGINEHRVRDYTTKNIPSKQVRGWDYCKFI